MRVMTPSLHMPGRSLRSFLDALYPDQQVRADDVHQWWIMLAPWMTEHTSVTQAWKELSLCVDDPHDPAVLQALFVAANAANNNRVALSAWSDPRWQDQVGAHTRFDMMRYVSTTFRTGSPAAHTLWRTALDSGWRPNIDAILAMFEQACLQGGTDMLVSLAEPMRMISGDMLGQALLCAEEGLAQQHGLAQPLVQHHGRLVLLLVDKMCGSDIHANMDKRSVGLWRRVCDALCPFLCDADVARVHQAWSVHRITPPDGITVRFHQIVLHDAVGWHHAQAPMRKM